MTNNDIPVKEIGEMLDMVSEKIPQLVKEIVTSVYSEEAATNMGKAVGTFYKQLIEAGIEHGDALQMTKEYMGTLQKLTPKMSK